MNGAHPSSRRSLPLWHAPIGRTSGASPTMHLIPGATPLVFLVDGSRLFAMEPVAFDRVAAGEPDALDALATAMQIPAPSRQADAGPPPIALSLNLSQVCNLTCGYCYADEGRFHAAPRLMSRETAVRAIDRLFDSTDAPRVSVGFIGGEPLLNRAVLHEAVAHAARRADREGRQVGFSIATNGTLLSAADVALLRDHAFSVSASLDGDEVLHNRQRQTRKGGSFTAALAGIRPLLDAPGSARVAARATVTRLDLTVAERVAALAGHGFTEIGVAPARTSADPTLALRADDWPRFLAEMIRAAEVEETRLCRGEPARFSNLTNALRRIHDGSCRALPCGAGSAYVSVSVDGAYYTCHRTIGDARFALGTAVAGPSDAARAQFISPRLVDRQEPCRSCWARYLCGGGCHAEVATAGRTGCDYIRGWLEHCLHVYNRLVDELPLLRTPTVEDLTA